MGNGPGGGACGATAGNTVGTWFPAGTGDGNGGDAEPGLPGGCPGACRTVGAGARHRGQTWSPRDTGLPQASQRTVSGSGMFKLPKAQHAGLDSLGRIVAPCGRASQGEPHVIADYDRHGHAAPIARVSKKRQIPRARRLCTGQGGPLRRRLGYGENCRGHRARPTTDCRYVGTAPPCPYANWLIPG